MFYVGLDIHKSHITVVFWIRMERSFSDVR